MTTVFEEKAKLEAKIKEDQSKLEKLEKESKVAARASHDDLIKAHGFSLQQLYPHLFSKSGSAAKLSQSTTNKLVGRSNSKKRPTQIIYTNPDDASQTWTGRGIAPAWLTTSVKKGTVESYLLTGASHTKKIAELISEKSARAGKKGASAKKTVEKAVKKSLAQKPTAKKVIAKTAVAKKVTVKKLAAKKAAKKSPHIAPKVSIA